MTKVTFTKTGVRAEGHANNKTVCAIVSSTMMMMITASEILNVGRAIIGDKSAILELILTPEELSELKLTIHSGMLVLRAARGDYGSQFLNVEMDEYWKKIFEN